MKPPPKRPATQVPEPKKSATTRQPAVRPQTQVHKAPTTRMPQEPEAPRRSTTRSVPRRASTSSGKKSPLPLILGIAGGALALIVVIALAAGGGGTKEKPKASNPKAPKPVDVASIERDAETKCEKGMSLVQKCEGLMTGRELSSSEKSRLKTDLEQGLALLVEGMSGFDKANSMAGKTYDVVKYSKTIKAARMKLGELGSK